MKLTTLYESQMTLEEAAKIFHEECEPFRKYTKHDFSRDIVYHGLYRGMEMDDLAKVSRVRKDRKPLNTPIEFHEIMDDWFNKKFGIRFRSNAMFAVQNERLASQYGTLYNVFPIGKFDICSSNKIVDLYEKLLYDCTNYVAVFKLNHINTENSSFIYDFAKKYSEDYEPYLIRILQLANYKLNTPLDDITDTSEVMINCDKYLAVRANYVQRMLEVYRKTYLK